jgi:hypothetical protein
MPHSFALSAHEKLRQLKLTELRDMVRQGMESDLSEEDPEAFFDRLIAIYKDMAVKQDPDADPAGPRGGRQTDFPNWVRP